MELPSHADPAYIAHVVGTLCVTGDVIEARVLGVQRAGHVSGYFDDFDRLAAAVAVYDGRAEAIYFTLNPVQPALLARGNNRLMQWARHTTSDADILRRRWLLIDLDPQRPVGISSSDAELEAALVRREEIVEWLDLAGFPPGLCGMSGNGAHLLYRLDNLPNDEEHTDLIRRCIAVIAARFDDTVVDVDKKVYNPSRLCKLYGTLVRKGENMPDRPHRRSRLDMPDTLPEPLSLDQMHWLASQAAEPARVTVPRTGAQVIAGRRLDVPAYLSAAGLLEGRDYRIKHKKGTTWYNLRICPVHTDPNPNFECCICQSDDGAMGAKCQHDSSKTWREFKAALGDPAKFYVDNVSARRELQDAPIIEAGLVQPAHAVESACHKVDLEEVLVFARCPMEHLWRYKIGLTPPITGNALVQETVRGGLFHFYSGVAVSPLEGVQSQWRDRLSGWGIVKSYELLDCYARLRLEITLPFLNGQIKKPSGETYRAPRMSQVYRQLSEQKGLLSLRAEIDQAAGGAPIVLTDDESLADLFADTIEIALRFLKPLPTQMIGIHEPFSVPLPDGLIMTGYVDLVLPGDSDKANLELWDFTSVAFPWPILRHDLQVIAALHARSDKWPAGVDRVMVRYVRTGQVAEVFGRTIPPWTAAALATALQATMRSTGVPRLAVSALQCKECPYWTECTSENGWNILGTASR